MKLFFLAIIFINNLYSFIDERKIDVYFINGMRNSQDQAEDNRLFLQTKIQNNILSKDEYLQKHVKVDLAYNISYGDIDDFAETYYQLRQEGQINNVIGFFDFFKKLYSGELDLSITGLIAEFNSYADIENIEADTINSIVDQYKNNTLNNSRKLLIVSHSQGTLFSNRTYKQVDEYTDYIYNLQIGSIADKVLGNGSYITLKGDEVVTRIQNSLPWNVENSTIGHGFISHYLTDINGSAKITENLTSYLNNLKLTKTQWEIIDRVNEDTCEYKLTLKNSITNEIIENVYPFSKDTNNSYVYKVPYEDSSEYVLANLGGNNIIEQNSSAGNCYHLEGTQQYIKQEMARDMPFQIFLKSDYGEIYMYIYLDSKHTNFYTNNLKQKDITLFHIYEYTDIPSSIYYGTYSRYYYKGKYSIYNNEGFGTPDNISLAESIILSGIDGSDIFPYSLTMDCDAEYGVTGNPKTPRIITYDIKKGEKFDLTINPNQNIYFSMDIDNNDCFDNDDYYFIGGYAFLGYKDGAKETVEKIKSIITDYKLMNKNEFLNKHLNKFGGLILN
ncbi:MAG: Unknown protein [uncultured Campylobacterales bacterium]|uniref:Uncharacterized protein n=1 Tax=uncultured Campylobacterales bacterium TaxID=352960 RepID=A0A6S6SU00_9BACT|nr:MAG: Unknown protein [uncultured Campylobacterales bacterium]